MDQRVSPLALENFLGEANSVRFTSKVSESDRFVLEVVQRYSYDPANGLQILREVQDKYAHITVEALNLIARELMIPRAYLEGLVDFYSFLHASPQGRYNILLSDNITDHLLGKKALTQYLCEKLVVQLGTTRPDGLVSIANTSCIGMADQGPAALINGFTLPRLNRRRVDTAVRLINDRIPLAKWPKKLLQVKDNIRRADFLLGHYFVTGSALHALKARGTKAILDEIDRSGLRGLGGAGFKCATKWAGCRRTVADERYVVCNADEGEPGTFKDRVLLQRCADLVFEGMTLCARVIGACQGYLYLRGEYRYLVDPLEAVLARRQRDHLLGEDILGIPGFSFDIELYLGAGAYICGEESALIESLEGKRGVPRRRPPFPVTCGLLDKPTVVNNVETFAAAAKIAVHGGDWFASMGTGRSTGTKLLSVSGDCEFPGVYEYPFGVTVRQVLEDCGAHAVQAVQVGGPAGHLVPASEFDRKIAYEDLATGGSFMIFNQQRDLLDAVRNFIAFFAHESCGFCTPCRIGTSLMKNLVNRIFEGRGRHSDLDEMRDLGKTMCQASHCGLGQTASNPVLDLLAKFPNVYQNRLQTRPAFDLDHALATARELRGRTLMSKE